MENISTTQKKSEVNNYYKVEYERVNSGISEYCRYYYKANSLKDVCTYVLSDFNLTLDDEDLEDDLEHYKINGEFCDFLSKGGDWIYINLHIQPVNYYDIKVKLEVCVGDIISATPLDDWRNQIDQTIINISKGTK